MGSIALLVLVVLCISAPGCAQQPAVDSDPAPPQGYVATSSFIFQLSGQGAFAFTPELVPKFEQGFAAAVGVQSSQVQTAVQLPVSSVAIISGVDLGNATAIFVLQGSVAAFTHVTANAVSVSVRQGPTGTADGPAPSRRLLDARHLLQASSSGQQVLIVVATMSTTTSQAVLSGLLDTSGLAQQYQMDLSNQGIYASGLAISYQQLPQVHPQGSVTVSLTQADVTNGSVASIGEAATSAQLPRVLTPLGVSPNVTVNIVEVPQTTTGNQLSPAAAGGTAGMPSPGGGGGGSGTPVGLIAGVAAGVVVAVLAATLGIFCWQRRSRRQAAAAKQFEALKAPANNDSRSNGAASLEPGGPGAVGMEMLTKPDGYAVSASSSHGSADAAQLAAEAAAAEAAAAEEDDPSTMAVGSPYAPAAKLVQEPAVVAGLGAGAGLAFEEAWRRAHEKVTTSGGAAQPLVASDGPAEEEVVSAEQWRREHLAAEAVPSQELDAVANDWLDANGNFDTEKFLRALEAGDVPEEDEFQDAGPSHQPMHRPRRSVDTNGLFPIEELLEDNRAPAEAHIPALVGPGFRAPPAHRTGARAWHRHNPSAILEGVEVSVFDNPAVAALQEVTAHVVDGTFLQETYLMEKGTRIGAHSIIRYARHHEQDLPVAIKFYADRATFLHECELLSSGVSVNYIPRVYQVVEATDHFPAFVVFERGKYTMAEWLQNAQPDLMQQKLLLHEVVQALDHLHRQGIVHMDVRPANIMKFPETDTWKLVGFSKWATMTETTPISYTLRYAPPEVVAAQSMGDSAIPAETSMDMWSYGVMAYELLSGQPFFDLKISDESVREVLVGHGQLPSETVAVLKAIPDRASQLALKSLLRRTPIARWTAGKVSSHSMFSTVRRRQREAVRKSLAAALSQPSDVGGEALTLEEAAMAELRGGALLLAVEVEELLPLQAPQGPGRTRSLQGATWDTVMRLDEVLKVNRQGVEDPVFLLRRGCRYRISVALRHGAGADMCATELRRLAIALPPGRDGHALQLALDCREQEGRQWEATAVWEPGTHDSAYINSLSPPAAKAIDTPVKTVQLMLGLAVYSDAPQRAAREVELVKALHFEMHPMRERFPERQAGYEREEAWRRKVPDWAREVAEQALLPIRLTRSPDAQDA